MSTQANIYRREVVGVFANRDDFDKTVAALLADGFSRSDLSVLASHDSLEAAGTDADARSWKSRLVGLLGELKYEGPLVTAGFIAIATGSVGAVIATLIAAGVGGVAIKELMDEVTARPHAAEFAKALADGSILLWVDTPNPADESKVKALLASLGATNIHTNERSA
ncbi:hypothetical protein [Telmatospirillum sp.]|uniref:hypothetical protein n=1 Tax=Telmatospirillum sp. TaxID=2079197 RepID=UPI00283CCC40|nr:hypothetical protein [Telmatospirillum sp.]MDR3440400.1 hypothetical protein [Telmatospirillum sp.]